MIIDQYDDQYDHDEFGRLEANARFDMSHDDCDDMDVVGDGYDDDIDEYDYDEMADAFADMADDMHDEYETQNDDEEWVDTYGGDNW